ncbi:MAG: heme-binding protein [Treponema sp.]|nr:heme-binding protein [Treponema sp.]
MSANSNMDNYIDIMEEQERVLVFDHFTRKDAWDLGHVFVDLIGEKQLPAPICIRLLSGLIVFQFSGDGTNADNQYWMLRKFRMVRDLEQSTLLSVAWFKKKGETLESRGLDRSRYADAGGGFPLRVKGAGIAGVATVSGLPQTQDHALLIGGISRYLGIENPPRLPEDALI